MHRLIQRGPLSLVLILLGAGLAAAQPYRVDTLARAPYSQYPVSVAFSRGGAERFFFTEKASGRVRYYDRGLRPEPFATFPVEDEGEQGLLGIAVHPRYPVEPYVYVFVTRQIDRANVVVRLRDSSGIGVDPTLLAIIPRRDERSANVGGRIVFGPDGKLYVAVGDYGLPDNARDLSSRRNYAGKILRLNPDGSTPPDTPFPDRPFWSVGHRDPTGMTFNDAGRVLYCTEGGTTGQNRVYAVLPGANVEWPPGDRNRGDLPAPARPLLVFPEGPQPALTSIVLYDAAAFPRMRGKFLIGGHANSTMWTGSLSAGKDSMVLEPFFRTNAGFADIEIAPDGSIVFTNGPYISSRILRLVPVVPAFLVLKEGPRGMAVDSLTWTVRWTPGQVQAIAGEQKVTLRAENGAGFAEQRFAIQVTNVNDPPTLFALKRAGQQDTLIVTGGDVQYTFRWERPTDPDGDSVMFSVQIDTAAAFNSPFMMDSLGRADTLRVLLPRRSGVYFWRVWASDGKVRVLSVPPVASLAVDYVTPGAPLRVERDRQREEPLQQNFPNPFNPATSITYTVPDAGRVRLAVYNLLGQEVALLVDAVQPAGTYTTQFENANLPSGIYFYRLQAPGIFETRKMVISK
jgi:glucose/arabinose dehydrogenase